MRRKQMLEASEQQEARSPKASAARGGERGRRMSVTLSREEAGLANEEEKAAKKKKEARSSGRRGAAQHSDLLSCACPKILAAETWRGLRRLGDRAGFQDGAGAGTEPVSSLVSR